MVGAAVLSWYHSSHGWQTDFMSVGQLSHKDIKLDYGGDGGNGALAGEGYGHVGECKCRQPKINSPSVGARHLWVVA